MRYAARAIVPIILASVVAAGSAAVEITLPRQENSLRMAVIGDSGTGDARQREVGTVMAEAHQMFPFDTVLMLGDNLYGSEGPADYVRKFEAPYKPLLDADVKFYASLGNHDTPNQANYRLFNMDGRRYYSFKAPRQDVRFFALDSNYMDPKQIEWIEQELQKTSERWKIAFFHHPIYSSGARHGSDLELRSVLEPLFMTFGVDVVFAGHEHFYERLKPQQGIAYFTNGGAAKLRRGNIVTGTLTAKGYDQDNSFMLVEIAGDELHFQTISRKGLTVDSGVVRHAGSATTTSPD
jgi:hypothetical protein